MPSHQVKQLSGLGKVKLGLVTTCSLIEFLVGFLAKVVPYKIAGWPVLRTAAVTFLRSQHWFSFEQVRSQSMPTGESIKTLCKAANLQHSAVELGGEGGGPPSTLHYIHLADLPEPKTVLYFHGGAYVSPMDIRGQLPFTIECARAANASDIVCLEYTLAPEAKYPTQLVQAAGALAHLLKTHTPAQILLGGDSAGGHLALSLVAHVHKPSPYAKPLSGIDFQDHKIGGVFVLSPWVSMKYDSASFRSNSGKDFLGAGKMTECTAMWNPTPTDIWAEFLTGGPEFWREIPVARLLVLVGSWEVFHDDVLEMAAQLDAKPFGSGAAVELLVADKEIHVQSAVDKAMGIPHGEGAQGLLKWLGSF